MGTKSKTATPTPKPNAPGTGGAKKKEDDPGELVPFFSDGSGPGGAWTFGDVATVLWNPLDTAEAFDKSSARASRDRLDEAVDVSAEEAGLHLNAQCYLLDHIEFYSIWNRAADEQHNRGDTDLPDSKGLKSYVGTGPKGGKAGFTCINGHPQEIVAKITKKEGLKEFFDIRPDQLALLMPRIRLFKSKHQPDHPDYKVIEFPFSTHGGLLSSKGARGDGAGIKSFELNYHGTNPAEAESYIEASLTLFFENIEAFTMKRNVDGEQIGFYDLIGYLPSDQRGRRSNATVPLSGDPDAYTVKVVLGWADPGTVTPSSPITKKLLKAIRQERRTYDLRLMGHELSFKQNGAVEVKVNYIAAIEGLLLAFDADVINHEAMSDQVHQETSARLTLRRGVVSSLSVTAERLSGQDADKIKQQELQGLLASTQQLEHLDIAEQAEISMLIEALADTEADPQKIKELALNVESFLETKQEELDTRIEDQAENSKGVKNTNETNLMERYAVLMRKIADMGALKVINLSPEQIGVYLDPSILPGVPPSVEKINTDLDEETQAQIQHRFNKLRDPPRPFSADASDPTRFRGNAAAEAAKKLEEGNKEISVVVERHQSQQGGDLDELKIHFFYLGDLIKAAFEIVHENDKKASKTLDQIKFLLGPLILKKPAKELTAGGNTYKTATVRKMIPLADVPISLDRFVVWFKEKVIKPMKTKYSLKSFITDVASDLVLNALGEGCFQLEKQTGNMVTTALQVPYARGGKSRIAAGAARLSINDILDAAELQPEKFGGGAQAMENILLLYHNADNESIFDKKTQEENFQKGVYPIIIGSNRGLVKEISFKKSDLPFIKAQYVTDQNSEKGVVREPYDANIRMVGNSIFVPGQTIYIDPYLPGAGSGGTIAHEIGLGGFFTVVTVDHSYDRSGYETDVKARWLSFGDNPQKIPEPVSVERALQAQAAKDAVAEEAAKDDVIASAKVKAELEAKEKADTAIADAAAAESAGTPRKGGKSKGSSRSRRRGKKKNAGDAAYVPAPCPQPPPQRCTPVSPGLAGGYSEAAGMSGQDVPPPAQDYSDEV
tara:strand:- start:5006 stop:8206 length:3201 start_codon:yes stop_codon:yes gene_type:complete